MILFRTAELCDLVGAPDEIGGTGTPKLVRAIRIPKKMCACNKRTENLIPAFYAFEHCSPYQNQ